MEKKTIYPQKVRVIGNLIPRFDENTNFETFHVDVQKESEETHHHISRNMFRLVPVGEPLYMGVVTTGANKDELSLDTDDELNIIVTLTSDEEYTELEDTYLTVTLSSTKITVGSSVLITASITDSNGNAIQDRSISIRIGSATVKGTTDANGLLEYTYTPTTAGTYSIYANYGGNTTTYNGSTSTTVTLTVIGAVTPDWYNADNWTNEKSISDTTVNITTKHAYYNQYSMADLKKVSFTYYTDHCSLTDFFGLYNPSANKRIGFIIVNSTTGRILNDEAGITYTKEDGVVLWKTGAEASASMTYNADEDTLTFSYDNANDSTTTIDIPLEGVDLSNYYVDGYSGRSTGIYLKDFTAED